MNQLTLVTPCLFGLESVLKFEISKIGGKDITVTDGKITYSGDEAVMVRSNLWLRTAERVCIVLGSFSAITFTELFDQVAELPLEEYIGVDDTFPVTGWSIESELHSIPSCQSIIKKAIVRRFENVYKKEIFNETGPIHQIRFSIYKDEVTIMLDTSGITLHKRGYRQNANLAPIRETLAAGIVDLARTRKDDVIYDPMCGSGTLLIEAAMRAMNIAPGLRRSFDAEDWGISDPDIWRKERKSALEQVDKSCKFRGIGYDIDQEVLNVARQNAGKAGVSEKITFTKQDISNFKPESPSITVCNPPYGERLMDEKEVTELYKTMSRVMPPFAATPYYIIGPHEGFEHAFGRKADKRRKLYNGMLPCQLYMYYKGK